MLTNETAKMTYTVASGVTQYAIGFSYGRNPDSTPQIKVYKNKASTSPLIYGTNYTISDDGLYVVLVSGVEVGDRLDIIRNIPMVQISDYVIGRIDPEQIENDFDLAVERDQQLKAMIDSLGDLSDIEERLYTIETEIDGLSTVATSGSYNDLLNKPTIPDTTNMQVTTNLVTSVSSASTDLQYPSAKLFYDTCGDIETLINAL